MHTGSPYLLGGCIDTVSPVAYCKTAYPQTMKDLWALYKDTANEQSAVKSCSPGKIVSKLHDPSAVLNTSKLQEHIPSRGTREG